MTAYTDQTGDEFTIEAGFDKATGERTVFLGGYWLDPDQARRVAHELVAAADAMTGLLVLTSKEKS